MLHLQSRRRTSTHLLRSNRISFCEAEPLRDDAKQAGLEQPDVAVLQICPTTCTQCRIFVETVT